MQTAIITLGSASRLEHVRRQQQRIPADAGVLRVVVWLDEEPMDTESVAPGALFVHVPPASAGLKLAAGRNAGAAAAIGEGATGLIFLDADCVPGDALIDRYQAALSVHPHALLAGPVTYLDEGITVGRHTDLEALTAPHAARPSPPDGEVVIAELEERVLFWSLSFAVTVDAWRAIGGFDETYLGYGGEDTDFVMQAGESCVPLAWVGGAHAYHQYHPTSSPPWQHLDDILMNGAKFAERWGWWPMTGWLEAFAAEGAIERVGSRWRRVPEADGPLSAGATILRLPRERSAPIAQW